MNLYLQQLWQANIEFSLLLIAILIARYAIRKTTKNYNAYLLWLCLPAGLIGAVSISLLDVVASTATTATLANQAVQIYLIEPSQALSSWSFLVLVWAGVSAILILRLIMQHHQLRSELKRVRDDMPHGLQSDYSITIVDKANFSPAVYGFFQPTIYFPKRLIRELSQEQLVLIVSHEECHIRQKHLHLNLLWDLLACVLWFNPVIYFCRQCFRHDQELYCDHLVLGNASQADKRAYGLALLSTVAATQSVSLLCSWKSFDQLEERIANIKRPSGALNTLLMLLFGLSIAGATSLYAAGDERNEASERFGEQAQVALPNGFGNTGFTQLSRVNGSELVNCAFIRHEDGTVTLKEGSPCTTKENGRERELTEEEKTTYLTAMQGNVFHPLPEEFINCSIEKNDDGTMFLNEEKPCFAVRPSFDKRKLSSEEKKAYIESTQAQIARANKRLQTRRLETRSAAGLQLVDVKGLEAQLVQQGVSKDAIEKIIGGLIVSTPRLDFQVISEKPVTSDRQETNEGKLD